MGESISRTSPSARLREVGTWLWFAFLGLSTVVLVLAGWLTRWVGAGPELLLLLGVAWLGVSALLGLGTLRLRGTRRAFDPLRRFVAVAGAVSLAGIVATAVYLVLVLIPDLRAMGLHEPIVAFMGVSFDTLTGALAWAGAPENLVGVASGPILLIVILTFTRNALNWRLDQLRYTSPRGDATPGPARRSSEVDVEEGREARAAAAARRVAVSSYAQAKAILESTQVELTFLALDIIGSTRMKQGEDPIVIDKAFADYRKMVEGHMRRHDAWKSTWTPDGQMAAFRDPQAAVDCGRAVLRSLADFNRDVSKMSSDFALRVGANLGTVNTDEGTAMEEISDFSIDVAGHMQKYASVNSIWVSDKVFSRLADPEGFTKLDREVDGLPVYEWQLPDVS